jgi:hypothetical protein
MPLRVVEPPPAVRTAAASHVLGLTHTDAAIPALKKVSPDHLALVAPHRVYVLGLDAILNGDGLKAARQAGWRYLLADEDRIVASAELEGDHGEHPLLNSGPFVASTAAAIDSLEEQPEVIRGEYELRLLKVPALYVVAAWLAGSLPFVAPLAPAPHFLQAGKLYTEREFISTLVAPAREALSFTGPSGG